MKKIEFVNLNGILNKKGIYTDITSFNDYVDIKEHKFDDSHIHSCCELFFNIGESVSFSVENKLYNINRGDIFIAKPNEVHHCVYPKNCVYNFYCMWLMCDPELSEYLSPFLDREKGSGNLITVEKEISEKILTILNDIYAEKEENHLNSLKSVTAIFNLLNILEKHKNSTTSSIVIPKEFSEILKFIDINFANKCSVNQISEHYFISRSTINRMFSKYLATTPTKYIENRRLSAAKAMLEKGIAVQTVCEQCGFPDYSHFISLFKRRFNITPFKYSKLYKIDKSR